MWELKSAYPGRDTAGIDEQGKGKWGPRRCPVLVGFRHISGAGPVRYLSFFLVLCIFMIGGLTGTNYERTFANYHGILLQKAKLQSPQVASVYQDVLMPSTPRVLHILETSVNMVMRSP